MADWNPRANAVFLQAVGAPDPDARRAVLDRECGDDPALRRAVEALLSAHAAAGSFLAAPHPAAVPPREGIGAPDRTSALPPDPTADLPPDGTRTGPADATVLHTPSPDAAGAVIAGRYRLAEPIGEGGMGTVWAADQTEPVKRRVAVKLIRADRGHSKAILTRFEAERQAIALMDHPHIAKLLDAGTTDAGAPFFVMELVRGVPLTDYCDAHRLTVPDRLALFGQICNAVQHAHQKGVIHRDLKPGNILVESHDGKPVPKVIDFGLAKAAGGLQLSEHSLFTGFGSVLGTPLYMAPEQATFNAVDVDTRADVYALGVLLYELLTGTTPIERATLRKAALDAILRVIREEEPPAPSSRISTAEGTPSAAAARQTEPKKLGRFVRGELDWIVLKALAKDRDRRYESATGLAKDVERFLNREPVSAGPPSAAYRMRKFVARNRAAVTAAGLVATALVLGVAGTALGLVEARNQRAAAVAERDEKEKARQAEAERAEGERQAKDEAVKAAAAEAEAKEAAQKAAAAERAAKQQEEKAKGEALAEADRATHAVNVNALMLAQAAWADGDPQKALSWLESVPEASRGWVWKYLRRQLDGGLFALHGHAEKIHHAAYSPDGQRIATASGDHTARVWDARTGRELHVLRGHTDVVMRVAFSPDGSRLATLALDNTLRLWDATTGRPGYVARGAAGFDFGLAFSPDGDRLAWSFGPQTVVTKLPAVNESLAIPGGFKGFSPDGRRLLTAAAGKTPVVRVWSADNGEEVGRLPVAAADAKFSPDGSRIATLEQRRYKKPDPDTNEVNEFVESKLAVWDATTLAPAVAPPPVPAAIVSFAFSPDGGRIVTLHPRDIRMWDVASGRLLFNTAIKVVRAIGGYVAAIAFRPDGRQVVTTADNGAQVWDAATGLELHSYGAVSGVGGLEYAPDGRRLVTYGGKVARVWDSLSAAPDGRFTAAPSNTSHGVALSPDGRLVAAGRSLTRISADDTGTEKVVSHTVVAWDLVTGRKVADLSPPNIIQCTAFSPDGARLAAAGGLNGDGIAVWDTRTWELVRTTKVGRLNLAYSPDGRLLATQNERFEVLILDAHTGEVRHVCPGHTRHIREAVFSPDGRTVLTVSWDGTARLWDAASGRPTRVLEPPVREGQRSGAFSPDGRWVAAGGAQRVSVWDAKTGRLERTLLVSAAPVGASIDSVRFTPDGRSLVTVGNGEVAALVWDVRTGQLVTKVKLPAVKSSGWLSAGFGANGTTYAVASHDGLVSVLDVAPSGPETPIPDQVEYVEGDNSGRAFSRDIDRTSLLILGLVDGNRRLTASPDGDHFALALADHTVRVWSSRTGREQITLAGHTGVVLQVVYSPDGAVIATRSRDGTARLWDARTGQLRHALAGHTDTVTDIAFARDGQRVLTLSNDKTARIWDVRTGQQVFRADGPERPFSDGQFSADGRLLLTDVNNRLTQAVWDIATQKKVTNTPFRGWNAPPVAPAGRYFPVRMNAAGKSWVVVVDREPSADEVARRTWRTGPDRAWHRAERERAAEAGDVFAERFHRARLPAEDLPGLAPPPREAGK